MYFLYRSRISLWEITPGFVKLYTPYTHTPLQHIHDSRGESSRCWQEGDRTAPTSNWECSPLSRTCWSLWRSSEETNHPKSAFEHGESARWNTASGATSHPISSQTPSPPLSLCSCRNYHGNLAHPPQWSPCHSQEDDLHHTNLDKTPLPHLINTPCCIHCAWNISTETSIGQCNSPNNIHTTINCSKHSYRTTSSLWNSHQSTLGLPVYFKRREEVFYKSSSIDYVVWFQSVQFSTHILRIFQSWFSLVDSESTFLKKLDYLTSYPTVLPEN